MKLNLGFRGMARAEWGIVSSIDRFIGPNVGRAMRERCLIIESELFKRYHDEIFEHLPVEVRRYFVRGLEQDNRALAWEVMAHYGCPTRLVDWTECPYFAALVASVEHPDSDGAIWWYDRVMWVEYVKSRWDRWAVPKRKDTGERHYEGVCFQEQAPEYDVVFQMFANAPFSRMKIQRGYHVASPSFGIKQEDVLREWLPGHFGKVIVPSGLKRDIRRWLWNERSLNAGAMDWPVADQRSVALADKLSL